MGTFLQDLQANFVEIALSDLNIPEGISVGYSAYVGLTNIFLGGSAMGRSVQAARTIETALISFADGSTPFDWSGAANTAASLAVGAGFIAFAPLTVSWAVVGVGVTLVTGIFAQALYNTIAQHYPNLIGDALDSFMQAFNNAADYLGNKIGEMEDAALVWAEKSAIDFVEFLKEKLLPSIPNLLANAFHDPIVLDLNGNGIELTHLANSSIHFDFAGDGFAERTGWIAPSDGILAIDANSNGLIDNGFELLGSPTEDGFAILEKLDTNGDGKIDAQDTDFAKLKVWRDLNQNGVSDAGELQSLDAAGIASISLVTQKLAGTNAGHGLGFEAAFTRADGTNGVAQTIYFQTDPEHSISDDTPDFTPSEEAQKIPQLPGSGLINSIAYKATQDATFLADWTALTDNAGGLSPAALREAFEALMLRWAGADEVDSASRGPYVDARHLAFLEKFFGDTYRFEDANGEARTYPTSVALGSRLEAGFQQIITTYEMVFLAQVAHSLAVRGTMIQGAADNPYLFFGLLDFSDYASNDPSAPDTPGNLGMVLDMILAVAPAEYGKQTSYLVTALSGLDGIVNVVFGGDRQSYVVTASPHLASITDNTIRDIATHIVDGTARFGTTHAEGINGTSASDVFVGGGGGDVESGGEGSDIYVYAKHDGDLWIKDQGYAPADSDKLLFTDLNAANVTLDRIGNDLLIRVTETGKTIAVTGFFAGQGIEVLRFADGTEWSRTQIKDASVFRGDGHNNTIFDSSSDDVIYGSQGDDYIRIGAGNDKILYGKGDGYDIVNDSSGSPTEHDTLVLTDLNASDVQLSRVGGHLVLTVKSTGEYIDFDNFFPVNTGDWNTTARNIDEIKFANGESWGREQIQQHAWYRGTDHADNISASELNDTIEGGKGDDILEGAGGSDTYVWKKGDGNDQITDASSKILSPSNTDVDTLWLTDVSAGDVSYSYQGKTLVLTCTRATSTSFEGRAGIEYCLLARPIWLFPSKQKCRAVKGACAEQ